MVSSPRPPYDALIFYDDGAAAIVSQAALDSAENIAGAAGGFYQILKGRELTERTTKAKKRHPRSAAGLSADSGNGRFLYLLVIDGRRPGSIGATEAETALLLKALGAIDGINLDGGGSSALVLRYPNGSVRAVNTPIHGGIPGRERAVAGCIGIALK
jgi:exopolysaccharide biosynthesis protein